MGGPYAVALPFQSNVELAATDQRVPGTLLDIPGWTKASKIYAYDPAQQSLTDTALQPTGPFDDPRGLESHEVKARSYDGTLIPPSIMYKTGLKLDGSNPTLLEGCGA